MENLHQLVSEQKDRIIEIRRDLHRMPETAYTEKKRQTGPDDNDPGRYGCPALNRKYRAWFCIRT
jgi:hypothetical protein